MSLLFRRKTEDFKCKNCGFFVKGNGYTNHCPKCLYSKHVDLLPGDRANSCRGLMKPIGILKKGQDLFIVHKCEKCGAQKNNRTSSEDDSDKILEISTLTY